MQKAPRQATERQPLSGGERLGLRVSAMINHPVAQVQRWVTIHPLDTDGQQDWQEMLEVLAATEGIGLTVNADQTITVRWAKSEEEESAQCQESAEMNTAEPPF